MRAAGSAGPSGPAYRLGPRGSRSACGVAKLTGARRRTRTGRGAGVKGSITMRVAVAGASGYAGGELLRLIAGHPELDLVTATADSSAGRAIGDVHASLAGHRALAGHILEPHGAVKGVGADLVFLALPAGQSAPVA